ncbi:MAG: hypothetical protein ACYC25_10050, partial [Paludibacter sp.]
QIIDTIRNLEQKWNSLRFGEVKVETVENQHLFEVLFYLSDLNPDHVQLELFSDGIKAEAPIIQIMKRGKKIDGEFNGYQYNASVPATRPANDFTVRAIPSIPTVSVPLEISRITWQH